VTQFSTVKQAKDYLANRIADEAAREGVPFSEIERKMLYFSETDWTLPDMKRISAEFDRDYDQNEYEQKIAGLVHKITSRDHSQSQTDTEAWDDAVVQLSEGDHYLLVLLDPSLSPSGPTVRPPHDRLKLWLTAFGIVFGLFVLVALGSRLFGPRFWAAADWFFEDRNRFGLLVLAGVLVWLLWKVRSDLKIILKGIIGLK
jgi:hypothetical protein